jgi:hypothetical protein
MSKRKKQQPKKTKEKHSMMTLKSHPLFTRAHLAAAETFLSLVLQRRRKLVFNFMYHLFHR